MFSKLKRIGRKTTAIFLALCLTLMCTFTMAPLVSAESLYDLQQEQQRLKKEKEATDARLAELREDAAKKREYRDDINAKIDIVQQELDNLRLQIDVLNQQIEDAETAIEGKQKSIGTNFDLLKVRLRTIYKLGEASKIEIVLSSQNIMDYNKKQEALKAISAHDNQLITELTEQLEEIQDELAKIKANKEELSEKKKEQDEKLDELSALYEEAQALLAEVEGAEAAAAASSQNLGDQIAENESSIKELEEQIKNMYPSGGGGSSAGGGGYAGTGSFTWPMPGFTYITCYYGGGGHRGIDVAGGGIYGKPIVAADGGFVEFAGWNSSYGYCVFINHGNGYQTRYAHMSGLATSSGASVGMGQTIGYVGTTGNSTGPHLHFEILYNGSTTNPFNYF